MLCRCRLGLLACQALDARARLHLLQPNGRFSAWVDIRACLRVVNRTASSLPTVATTPTENITDDGVSVAAQGEADMALVRKKATDLLRVVLRQMRRNDEPWPAPEMEAADVATPTTRTKMTTKATRTTAAAQTTAQTPAVARDEGGDDDDDRGDAAGAGVALAVTVPRALVELAARVGGDTMST